MRGSTVVVQKADGSFAEAGERMKVGVGRHLRFSREVTDRIVAVPRSTAPRTGGGGGHGGGR